MKGFSEVFMSLAISEAKKALDEDEVPVGCIIVKNKRVISAGYNGFIAGLPHKSVVRDGHEQNTVHAEQNAIVDAARRGVSLEGSTAYITHYPCIICSKLLIASGIKQIIYHKDYKNDELVRELMEQSDVTIRNFNN